MNKIILGFLEEEKVEEEKMESVQPIHFEIIAPAYAWVWEWEWDGRGEIASLLHFLFNASSPAECAAAVRKWTAAAK